ncbi:hypothetical protein ACWIUD_09600 [Helicobacter sp. 23-1044]
MRKTQNLGVFIFVIARFACKPCICENKIVAIQRFCESQNLTQKSQNLGRVDCFVALASLRAPRNDGDFSLVSLAQNDNFKIDSANRVKTQNLRYFRIFLLDSANRRIYNPQDWIKKLRLCLVLRA